jgi:hypothetical protein
MPDISIQFHALPKELLTFTKQCVSDFNLHVVAMRSFPFEAIKVAYDQLDDIFAESSPYTELVFFLYEPMIMVRAKTFLYDENPDGLHLDVPRVNDKGLRQAWLATRTANADAIFVWRKIAARLKKITKAGVIVINPDSGASGVARTFRYTAGAKVLESSGIVMRPGAGGNIVKLGSGEE